jgi:mono/diheme cytochrome c family protein
VRAFIFGLIIGVIAVPFAVYAWFGTGSVPVATSAAPMPYERTLAHRALQARISKEMPKNVPIPAEENNYKAGAQIYRDNCAVCHGFSDGSASAIAQGMFPKPPRLLKGTGVTDDQPGETYWKVANGIRLTGMPGFKESLSDTQMWQVSLLLANADKLPESAKALLTPASPVCDAQPCQGRTGDGGRH